MNCEQIEPWISAYQDGELDGRRRRIAREHLERCPACRALSEEWDALARELRAGLHRREAPESLHARVMRRIPEPARSRARGARVGSWRPQGWLSFGLAPIAAAAAWLLLAAHATRPVALLSGDRAPTVLAAAPTQPGSRLISSTQSTEPAGAGAPHRNSSAIARPKPPRHPRVVPESTPAARPGKAQGTDHPETELQRQMRRLRPRRWRYPVAECPSRPWMPRRARQRIVLAWPPPPAPAARDTGATAPPRITVVEYVLPEVPPPGPAPEGETDFVLRPAASVQAAEAGFDL